MENISLQNKKILIVDDEPDVLDSLEELLDKCTLVRAGSFEEAKKYLDTEDFDIAILDIMGVNGYDLLETACQKNVLPVMLTAHALTPDNIKKSYHGGAFSFIPKEEMVNIETFLVDVLKAKEEGRNPWTKWYDRLSSFLVKKFGPEWDEDDKEFWKKNIYY